MLIMDLFTYQTPTKSILFNPNITDGKGTMHIDWNNLDIFKSLTPIIGINTPNYSNGLKLLEDILFRYGDYKIN